MPVAIEVAQHGAASRRAGLMHEVISTRLTLGSIASFWSGSPCPCADCCAEDSAIRPGTVHRRQLCQPHQFACCMRLEFDMLCSSKSNTFTAFPARLPAASATLLALRRLQPCDPGLANLRSQGICPGGPCPKLTGCAGLSRRAPASCRETCTGISGADFLL